MGHELKEINDHLLTGPGEDLVPKLLMQLSSINGFKKLFGEYEPKREDNRWADYQRSDWSIRMLPAINIFEAQTESKESDQAFMTGTIQIQTYWPPAFRRSESRRVELAFKGALENFFESQYAIDMIDELDWHIRPIKVWALNEIGRTLTWSPNVETIIGTEMCPVTMLNVTYKIDLRAWYRALEFMGRTKENPFENTLNNLQSIGGDYQGLDADKNVGIDIPDQWNVSNP